jgi:hypothetical protein
VRTVDCAGHLGARWRCVFVCMYVCSRKFGVLIFCSLVRGPGGGGGGLVYLV